MEKKNYILNKYSFSFHLGQKVYFRWLDNAYLPTGTCTTGTCTTVTVGP